MLVVIVAPSYINIKIHAFLFIRKFTRERGVCVLSCKKKEDLKL